MPVSAPLEFWSILTSERTNQTWWGEFVLFSPTLLRISSQLRDWRGRLNTVKPPATLVQRPSPAAPQDPSSSVSSSSCSCTATSCWLCSSSCCSCLSSTRSSFSCSSPSLFASSRPLSRFSELSKQPESRGWLESLDLSSFSGSESSSATKKYIIYTNEESRKHVLVDVDVLTYSLSVVLKHSGSWCVALGRWCWARWGETASVLQSPPGFGNHAWRAKNSAPERQKEHEQLPCRHQRPHLLQKLNKLTLRPMLSSTSSRVLGLDLSWQLLLLRCLLLAGGLSSGSRLT